MKQYRLTAWPDFRLPFDKTPYRRMLNDMSHRHVSLAQLVDSSGLRRREVRRFVEMLCQRGLIGEREADAPRTLLGAMGGPVRSWLRLGAMRSVTAR